MLLQLLPHWESANYSVWEDIFAFSSSKLHCAPLIKVSTTVFPQLTSCEIAERDMPENKNRKENFVIAMGKESTAYFRSTNI